MKVYNAQGSIEGRAIGLDPSGALLVEQDNGERVMVVSGEISLID